MDTIPDNKTNGTRIDFDRIKKAVDASGLSLRAIAERTGGQVTHGNVHDLTIGKFNDAMALKLRSVCEVLGIPFDEIFIEPQRKAA